MDTPETNKAERMAYAGEYMVPTEFARRLERERDEAREAFVIATDQMVVAQCKLRESNKERDEAQAARATLRLDAQKEAQHHDKMVGELEKVYAERDETREQAQRLRVQLNHYTQANEMAEQAFRERDEAHKIAERAIGDLAWFNETNAQILRDQLEQLKGGTK